MPGHRVRRGAKSAYRLWLPRTEEHRLARNISRVEGDALVERGVAFLVYDELEHRYDYELLPEKEKKVDNGAPVGYTPVALTARDAALIAGLHGRSRTEGRPEDCRLARVDSNGKRQPAEDEVERAKEKLRLWPMKLPNNRKLREMDIASRKTKKKLARLAKAS